MDIHTPSAGIKYTRAFSSLGCPSLSLKETIALAKRHQIEAIELRALGNTLDLPVYFRSEFETPAALANFVASQSIRIVSLDTSLRLVGNNDHTREEFLAYIPWAEALGGICLRVFDGGKSMDDRELSHAVDTIAWWRRKRAENKWQSNIMIETHDSLLTISTLRRFLDAVPQDVALLWDTHHTWKVGGETPEQTWSAVCNNVSYIHVKDSVEKPTPRAAYSYVLPGTGIYPMEQLMDLLRRKHYSGVLSLEWEKQWHPELPSLDEALVSAKKTQWW